MLILPLDHSEPYFATLGVMLCVAIGACILIALEFVKSPFRRALRT
jgi:hypothetical protein